MNEALRQQTIETYDNSAQALAEYFKGIGPRIEDIELALNLAGNPDNARVLEIGCGDGRDAQAILSRCSWYSGFDISKSMINIARQTVPDATFEVADATSFDYPKDLDIVFAFASLLHLDRNELKMVFAKVHAALKLGGIFYVSLKERPEYGSEVKQDKYGSRLFYFYNTEIVTELAGENFENISEDHKTISDTAWFELALRKS